MTTWAITFADTFINELLNIPKSISKKVTKKIKILEQDPISAQGDAKKLKGYGNNIYRVRLGSYRLFYSFGSGWVKLLSVRKRDDRTYELEIPEFTAPNLVPEVSSPDLQITPSFVKQEEREKTVISKEQELPEDNKSKSTTTSDLPFKFTSSRLEQWQIPQEYWQKILKVKHSDDILDLPIPDRLISRILDNCFPRDVAEIERSPEYKLTKPEDLERFVAGAIEAFLLKLDPEQETESFIVTLQYALERAIQARYKLENDELSSERIGKGNHILFWESAEGGAGVLSQILEDEASMQKIARQALDICHFVEPKDSCAQACYQCLLSYTNQFDHPHLNRHLIHDFLIQLSTSAIDIELNRSSREAQYQQLWEQTDPHSSFEREVLTEIYQRGIKLPDSAQELIPEANCKPDFLYKKYRVAIFCDGSVHNSPEQQQRDRIKRDNLQWSGYTVVELNYQEDWYSSLEQIRSLI